MTALPIAVQSPNTLLQTEGALAVAVLESAARALPSALSEAFGGHIERQLEAESFGGKAGSAVALPTLGRIGAPWVFVVGAGSGSPEDLRLAAGAASFAAREHGQARLSFSWGGSNPLSPESLASIAEGVVAGNYRFDRYQAEASRKPALASFTLLSDQAGAAQSLAVGERVGRAQNFARDLVNLPAAEIYPETLARIAAELAGPQMSVEIWDEHQIREAGMGGVTAVGQGSDRKPRFVHMTYRPQGPSRAEVAIIGKGVTFDSGGLSIKTTEGMLTMRCDMGGAGAVVATMSALADLGVPVTVHGIFAAAENMLSGSSYKLGDILRMYNGKTVEVLNTDAEGRLLLADCLSYASKLPISHVIDLATLTGAAVVALGEHYSALYADDDGFAQALQGAASRAGEAFWRMPLEPLYKEIIKGEVGQIKNVGNRWGGSITAALFLQEFVDGPKWIHLDIAGPAFISAQERHLAKGATGAGVTALLYWLRSL